MDAFRPKHQKNLPRQKMGNFESNFAKSQMKAQEESQKSMWTLSWRIKGMAIGAGIMFFYVVLHLGQDNPKMVIAGGILGYFIGWLLGMFFYTKK